VTDIDQYSSENAMNKLNAADRDKTVAEFEGETQRIRIVAKAKAKQKVKNCKVKVLPINVEKLLVDW
jgi:hypothetical protein